MLISQAQFEHAMQTAQSQITVGDRSFNARIALAWAEVLRLPSLCEDGAKHMKSGIMDSRKIYLQPLKNMSGWRPWSEHVLRWALMQSTELHTAFLAATKDFDASITHGCGD